MMINGLHLSFAQGTPGTYVNELIKFGYKSPAPILDISPGVPGYVAQIWMTMNSPLHAKHAILNVYIDGENSPSMHFDLGSIGSGCGNRAARLSTHNIGIETNGSSKWAFLFKYPIPFRKSIVIKLIYDYDPTICEFWSITRYFLDITIPYKLWSNCVKWIDAKNYTPKQQGDGSVQFLKLTTGTGTVVYHSIQAIGATNLSFLENNPVMYLNNLQPGDGIFPQIDSSGTEDYFTSAFYFLEAPACADWYMIWEKSKTNISCAIDFLALHKGIPFTNGILMRWEEGLRENPGTSTTDVKLAWNVLYYSPN